MSIMDQPVKTDRPFRIALLLIDGFALMSYSSVVEPLRAANLMAQRTLYEIINVGLKGAHGRCSGAAEIPLHQTVDDPLQADLLLVVAGGDPIGFSNAHVFSWLRRLARQGQVIGGVSGGPVLLATAGLMDGYRMTVHWEHAAALDEVSPDLLLERSLYVIDRDRITCGGGTAPMDLMHWIISSHHGSEFAQSVSDWFLHTDVRPSEGPQRGGLVQRFGTTNRAVVDAIGAMETHIADPLKLDQLAQFTDVSARQLNRLFRRKFAQSAVAFYRDMRLDKARNLLRNSPQNMTEIALATGFSSSSHFSKTHSKAFGVPPKSLRE